MAIQFNSVSANIAIFAANPAIDGTGTITTLITGAAANGTILDTVQIQSRDANIARGMIRFFIRTGVGGTWRLFKEVPVYATNTQTLIGLYNETINFDLPIAAGDFIGVTTENASNFNFIAFGYDITGFI